MKRIISLVLLSSLQGCAAGGSELIQFIGHVAGHSKPPKTCKERSGEQRKQCEAQVEALEKSIEKSKRE